MTTLVETNDDGPIAGLAAPPTVLGPALSPEEARTLTEEFKANERAQWEKALQLYEGRAHKALGYSSWHAYWEAEIAEGKSNAYRVLDAARVLRVLADSPNGERLNEAQARELVQLLNDEKLLVEAHQLALAEAAQHGGRLTATHVREAVAAVREAYRDAAETRGQLGLLHATRAATRPIRKAGAGLSSRPIVGPSRRVSTIRLEDIPAALAASQRNVDAVNKQLGWTRWGETSTMARWRRRLAESRAATPEVQKVIAAIERLRAARPADHAALTKALEALREVSPEVPE